MGLLSRFNLVFDYSRQRLFIEPNHGFDEPFEYDMSGVRMRPGGGPYLEIVQIHADSPASEAGLQVGDKVARINGRAATQYGISDLRSLMLQEGATLTLVLLRDDKEEQVALTLRRLI